MKIQIPKSVRPGFDAIAKLSQEQIELLSSIIRETPLGVREQAFETMFVEKSQNAKGIQFNTLQDTYVIARALHSLAGLIVSSEELLEDILRDISLAYAEYKESPPISSEIENLIQNLLLLLSSSSTLITTAKAKRLLHENERVYIGTRIISDMRLVFNKDIHETNRPAIIVHQLKIEYAQLGEEKEFFIALSSEHLEKLKKEIERALEKENAIKESYGKTIQFIDFQE